MRRAAMVGIGILALAAVTFAHPFQGNTLGFCPPFKSPLHAANDLVVAAIDLSSLALVFRGMRRR